MVLLFLFYIILIFSSGVEVCLVINKGMYSHNLIIPIIKLKVRYLQSDKFHWGDILDISVP